MPFFNGFPLYAKIFFNPLPFPQIANCITAHATQPVACSCYKNSRISIGTADNEVGEQRFGTERNYCSRQKTGKK